MECSLSSPFCISKLKGPNWMTSKISSSFQVNHLLMKHHKNGQLFKNIYNKKKGNQREKGKGGPLTVTEMSIHLRVRSLIEIR